MKKGSNFGSLHRIRYTHKMIPPTPTSLNTMPASAKAKIAFSIDSIVGDESKTTTTKENRNEFKYVNEYQTEIARALRLSSDSLNAEAHIKFRSELNGNNKDVRNLFDYTSTREQSLSPSSPYQLQTALPSEDCAVQRSRSPSPHRTPTAPHIINNNNNNLNNNNSNNSNNTGFMHSSGNNTSNNNVDPMIPLSFVNGLHPSGPIRPMPIVPPANLVDTKTLPSYLGLGAGAHANPHLLQIQMAAALAQRQAAEQGFAQASPFRPAPPPHLVNPAMSREGYPLYPW